LFVWEKWPESPLRVMENMLNEVEPRFETVIVCVEESPSATSPKFKLSGKRAIEERPAEALDPVKDTYSISTFVWIVM
jgi:hypothetical protein